MTMWSFISRWRAKKSNAMHQEALNAAIIRGSTAVAIIATRLDGIISLFNSGAEAMLGYRADELVGIKTPAILHDANEVSDHGRALECTFGEAVSGFEIFVRAARIHGHETRAWTYIKKDGTRIRVSLTITALHDTKGRINGYMAIANDISEYSALQRQLSISQLSFLNAFATAAHGMAIVSPHGTWLEVNISLCEILGYSHDDLLKTDFQHITHPHDLGADLELVQQCLSGVISSYQLEKRCIHSDGSTVYALLSVSLVRDDEQEPLYFISHIQDFSSRHAAQQRLLEREHQLQTVVDTVVDAIITINAEGKIESFNHAAEELFGYLEHEVQNQSLKLLLPQSASLPRQALFMRSDRTGSLLPLPEIEGRRADGSHFWMEVQIAKLSNLVESRQVVVVRDITERRRVERMKEEFISTVSHELRTPLTAIVGSLDMVVTGVLGELNADQEKLLTIAQRNSQRLSYLINDLLDMDKLVSGSIEMEIEAHELAPIVTESISLNSSYASQFGVNYQYSGSCSDEVMVDSARLQQVLANFLSNAAKFSPENSMVDVVVSDCGPYARISVMDRGVGIPEAKWFQLFAKFSQLDSSDTRQRSGTGLGLAITKALAESMQARVGYEPRKPNGSVFYIELLKKTPAPMVNDLSTPMIA
ncbi:MAG: PAS domain S-box protein [Paraperlucidibaca sp.]|nr:PAS domain S-box protein [Paraperlucidibaca sp.]